MQRRNFIKSAGATAVSLPILLNGLRLSAMSQSALFNMIDPESDKVLVLIQMNGGNDGLNMIIPRDQYSGLAAVRSNILIPENELLKVDDLTGFHPAMKALKVLYDDARVGVVQSVGYPNQNRSHFRSIDIWTSGSPAEKFWNTGWLGRHFEEQYPGFPEGYPNGQHPHPFAITMGSIVSETCQGTIANYSMALEDPFNLFPLFESEGDVRPDTPYGNELDFLRTSIAQTNAYSEKITEAANLGSNQAEYAEGNRLARQLKNVALLISGGLQTKIYVVNIGGFDTHAAQVVEGNPMVGEHATLLEMVSNAIATFQNDLKAQGLEHRVVGMTFSEFGRKIRSNESLGTDHGTAAPLILFGSCIRPGMLGENPEIHRDVHPSEGVPMQYDFRDVYGSLLVDWFELEESAVRSLLHENFQKLPIIEDCRMTTSAQAPLLDDFKIEAWPNPFDGWAQIGFTLERPAWVRLSLFNAIGGEEQVLTNQNLGAGAHQIPLEGSRLPVGTYFYRLQIGNQVRTKRLVKVG